MAKTKEKNVETATKENREYKDSVFVNLFYEDETAEKNMLSLYNALHNTDYQNENVIHKLRIEKILYKNFKNDISFEMNGTVLIFGEHQSTVNSNMPLRCLMYAGRAYEQLADYLKRKGSEVTNMLIAEYSYEEDIEVKQQEAMLIGERRGKKLGEQSGKRKGILLSGMIFQAVKKSPDLTNSQIARDLDCTIEDVKNVRKMFEI